MPYIVEIVPLKLSQWSATETPLGREAKERKWISLSMIKISSMPAPIYLQQSIQYLWWCKGARKENFPELVFSSLFSQISWEFYHYVKKQSYVGQERRSEKMKRQEEKKQREDKGRETKGNQKKERGEGRGKEKRERKRREGRGEENML